MPIWVIVIWVGIILLQPLIMFIAIREVYRRVVLTDRGLAAACSAIFTVITATTFILPFSFGGPQVTGTLLWIGVGSVVMFVILFALMIMMIPSLHYMLRNVPRAERK